MKKYKNNVKYKFARADFSRRANADEPRRGIVVAMGTRA